jgi:hypothetical protein
MVTDSKQSTDQFDILSEYDVMKFTDITAVFLLDNVSLNGLVFKNRLFDIFHFVSMSTRNVYF